jgi:hypothetical protein
MDQDWELQAMAPATVFLVLYGWSRRSFRIGRYTPPRKPLFLCRCKSLPRRPCRRAHRVRLVGLGRCCHHLHLQDTGAVVGRLRPLGPGGRCRLLLGKDTGCHGTTHHNPPREKKPRSKRNSKPNPRFTGPNWK